MAQPLQLQPFTMSRRLSAVLLASFLALPALAATRITFDIHGAPTAIEWAAAAFPLRYEIDPRVNQLHPNARAMVDRAFAAWSSLPEANIRFEARGTSAASHGQGIKVDVADQLLSGQGAMAITTYSYDESTGNMVDADISVDPSLFNGSVNAQAALEHEVGHTLGLDHSAVISSVMYPYVGPNGVPAELDVDDRIGISTIYPKSDPTLRGATLQGRVYGADGAIFAAQVVAVNEQGQPVATTLTNAAGEFTLLTVPTGRYRLYAEPLDGPVVVASMQGTWRAAPLKPFATEFYDGTLDVTNGQVYGNLVVNTGGGSPLNPRVIGSCAADGNSVSLTTTPVVVKPGDSLKLTIGGDGFVSGQTQFEVLNPAFRRTSDFEYWGGAVSATYAVAADAATGSSVIVVRNGADTAALTGALKVHRPAKTRAARS